MSAAPDKSCSSCRSSFAIPGTAEMICRRFPPATHVVGHTTIAGSPPQPIIQSVFPGVNGFMRCEEWKAKLVDLPTEGNVTTLEVPA